MILIVVVPAVVLCCRKWSAIKKNTRRRHGIREDHFKQLGRNERITANVIPLSLSFFLSTSENWTRSYADYNREGTHNQTVSKRTSHLPKGVTLIPVAATRTTDQCFVSLFSIKSWHNRSAFMSSERRAADSILRFRVDKTQT